VAPSAIVVLKKKEGFKSGFLSFIRLLAATTQNRVYVSVHHTYYILDMHDSKTLSQARETMHFHFLPAKS
jgi:hypothetical protein